MQAELEVLTHTPGMVLAALLGLLWGSFANVCIYRWPPTDEFPKGRSVVLPGSHCGSCKAPIAWYDNVPILSYLWLRGRCRRCKAEFSPRYLLVEATMALLFVVAWWFTFGTGGMFDTLDHRAVRFVVDAVFIFVMVVIAFIDLDTQLVLNMVTAPAVVIFYGATWLLPSMHWYDGLIGAAVGYGGPWLIGEIYFRITEREGLGLGDSTLLAAVGALLGWKGVVVALFGGSMIGVTLILPIALVRHFLGKPAAELVGERTSDDEVEQAPPSLMKTPLPFGPFLVMGALFYLFAAPWIDLHFRL